MWCGDGPGRAKVLGNKACNHFSRFPCPYCMVEQRDNITGGDLGNAQYDIDANRRTWGQITAGFDTLKSLADNPAEQSRQSTSLGLAADSTDPSLPMYDSMLTVPTAVVPVERLHFDALVRHVNRMRTRTRVARTATFAVPEISDHNQTRQCLYAIGVGILGCVMSPSSRWASNGGTVDSVSCKRERRSTNNVCYCCFAGVLPAVPSVLPRDAVNSRSAAGLGGRGSEPFSAIPSWHGASQRYRDQLLVSHWERQVDTAVHHAARLPTGSCKCRGHGEFLHISAWRGEETFASCCSYRMYRTVLHDMQLLMVRTTKNKS